MPPSSDRAPFFHNRSAADLPTVVNFYNERFAIGLTWAQMSDLVEFLSIALLLLCSISASFSLSGLRRRGHDGESHESRPSEGWVQLLPALGGPRLGARGAAFGP
jgi:hypothetical protein